MAGRNQATLDLSRAKISVDEDLPNFFKAVKLRDADWLVSESENLRKKYGISMVPQEVERQIDLTQSTDKAICNVPWYNILANPVYARQFNFIEVNVPDRAELIVDGNDDDTIDCE